MKVGDIVHCISVDFYNTNIPKPRSGDDPFVGGVYTIKEIWEGCLFLEEVNSGIWCFEQECFELLKDTSEIINELEYVESLSI